MMLLVIELWGGPEDGRLIRVPKDQLNTYVLLHMPNPVSLTEILKPMEPIGPAIKKLVYERVGHIRKGRHIYKFKGIE